MKDFWNDEFALQYFYSFFDLIEPGFTNLNTTYMLVKKRFRRRTVLSRVTQLEALSLRVSNSRSTYH